MLAKRTDRDPKFFGSSVYLYLKETGSTLEELADLLGLMLDQLALARICHKPAADDPETGIERIAYARGVDADLIRLILFRDDGTIR